MNMHDRRFARVDAGISLGPDDDERCDEGGFRKERKD